MPRAADTRDIRATAPGLISELDKPRGRGIIEPVIAISGGGDTVSASVNGPRFLYHAVLVLSLALALLVMLAPQATALDLAGARWHDIAEDPAADYQWLVGIVLVLAVGLLAFALLRKALRIAMALAAVVLIVAACVGVAYWVLSSSSAPFILPS